MRLSVRGAVFDGKTAERVGYEMSMGCYEMCGVKEAVSVTFLPFFLGYLPPPSPFRKAPFHRE